jgi:starch phosphorylase
VKHPIIVSHIEIREQVGEENIFIFGLTVEQVRAQKSAGAYHPWELYRTSPTVRRVLDAFRDGRFCPDARGRHDWVYRKLLAGGEQYFHVADLESYLEAHEAAGRLYRERPAWAAKAIRNVARVPLAWSRLHSLYTICCFSGHRPSSPVGRACRSLRTAGFG